MLKKFVEEKADQRNDILKRMSAVCLDRATHMPWEEQDAKLAEMCKRLTERMAYIDDDLKKLKPIIGAGFVTHKPAEAQDPPGERHQLYTSARGLYTPTMNFDEPVTKQVAKLIYSAKANHLPEEETPAKHRGKDKNKGARNVMSRAKQLELWNNRDYIKGKIAAGFSMRDMGKEFHVDYHIISKIYRDVWTPRAKKYVAINAPLEPVSKTPAKADEKIDAEKRKRDAKT